MALAYRNWFVFTRVTFAASDPFSSHFKYGFVYPKIKPEITEELYNYTRTVDVKAKISVIKYHEIDESEIPPSAPSPAPDVEETKTALREYLTGMDVYDLRAEVNYYKKNMVFSDGTLMSFHSVLELGVFEKEFDAVSNPRLVAAFPEKKKDTGFGTPKVSDPVPEAEVGGSKSLYTKTRRAKVRKAVESEDEEPVLPPEKEKKPQPEPDPVKEDPPEEEQEGDPPADEEQVIGDEGEDNGEAEYDEGEEPADNEENNDERDYEGNEEEQNVSDRDHSERDDDE